MMRYSIMSKMLIMLPLVISACASSQPAQFYLLRAMPPQAVDTPQTSLPPLRIAIKPLIFPDYLDRPQIVLRQNDYKLLISEQHRWAEPLQDSFLRVLIENLTDRLDSERIDKYHALNPKQLDYQLRIEILRMDSDEDLRLQLKVKWSLWDGRGKNMLLSQIDEYNVVADDEGYEALIEAHSKAVASFADTVTTAVLAIATKSDR